MSIINMLNDPYHPSIITRDHALCLSGVGLEREHNEDACGIACGGSVIAVSDGMGGLPAGECASQAAIHAALGYLDVAFRKASVVPMGSPLPPDESLLTEAIASAGRAVDRLAKQGEDGRLPGCTLVIALLRSDCVTIAHVGDSRAYVCLRARGLRTTAQLVRSVTNDHAVQHELSRCLGARRGFNRTPDVAVVPLVEGDTVMLCSDGLTGCVDDDGIERLWLSTRARPRHHEAFARALYDACLADGAHDNVSIALASVR